MGRLERAAQFSPFAALSGHEAMIEETARLTEAREVLGEDQRQELSRRLTWLQKTPGARVTLRVFIRDERKEGGRTQTIEGSLKRIDAVRGLILLRDGRCVPLADLLSIESDSLPQDEMI